MAALRPAREPGSHLVRPDATDSKVELLARYATVRSFAPAFLDTFAFQGSRSSACLLKAVGILRESWHTKRRSLLEDAPVGFIRRSWRAFVLPNGKVSRRPYELCVLSELRDRLRAGDVWVEGSQHYQSFDAALIPQPSFDLMKAAGPLPIAVSPVWDTHRLPPPQCGPHRHVGSRGRYPLFLIMVRDRRHAQLHAVRPERRRQARDVGDNPLRLHRQVQPLALALVPGEEDLPGAGINPPRLQAERASRRARSGRRSARWIRIVPAVGQERDGQVDLLWHSGNADMMVLRQHRQSRGLRTIKQLPSYAI